MMVTEKNGNGKLREKLYVLALTASLIFIVIDKILVPTMNSGKLADAVNTQAQQIARLEECVIQLRPLPGEVAGIKVSLEGLRVTLDRLEKKVDSPAQAGR